MPDEAVQESTRIDLPAERSKPRLVSLLFFDYFNETKGSKLNLLGIFDRLFVDSSTKKTTPVGIFVRVANAFDSKVRCSIYTPEGATAGGFAFIVPGDTKMPDGGKPIQSQILVPLQFDAPVEGHYWFSVSFENQILGGAPLLIEHRDMKEFQNEPTRGDA